MQPILIADCNFSVTSIGRSRSIHEVYSFFLFHWSYGMTLLILIFCTEIQISSGEKKLQSTMERGIHTLNYGHQHTNQISKSNHTLLNREIQTIFRTCDQTWNKSLTSVSITGFSGSVRQRSVHERRRNGGCRDRHKTVHRVFEYGIRESAEGLCGEKGPTKQIKQPCRWEPLRLERW